LLECPTLIHVKRTYFIWKYDRCISVSHSLQVHQIVHEIPCASIVRYRCLSITFSLHICISNINMVFNTCTWPLVLTQEGIFFKCLCEIFYQHVRHRNFFMRGQSHVICWWLMSFTLVGERDMLGLILVWVLMCWLSFFHLFACMWMIIVTSRDAF
jgi:hypothetical protein